MKAQRQISLEILRILCMLFIVTGHIGGRSGIESFPPFAIAPHAVNCFVLISGYFLITSKFKIERALRVINETIFYTFTITIILYLFGKADLYDITKSIMPFAPTKFSYWFVNKYLAVILLSPFICKVCATISKRQYQILLATLLLIASSLLIVFPFAELFGNSFSLLWMITVFITGGYLRLYEPEFKYWGTATLGLLILYNICNIYGQGVICLGYNSLITWSLAIATFMWFKNLQILDRGIIAKTTTFIAPHVFAAYLIHEQGLMRTYIVDLLNKFQGYMPNTLYLYLFGIAVIIFSAFIDKGRMLLFKYTGIDQLTNKIACRLNKLYEG
ncbi:MAG: acyltransferase family protein [Bacteroidaceae bacterium]|nr:acyltransferase family protein [Bacteroidaceae bacterium]